jgi:ribosomal protein L33
MKTIELSCKKCGNKFNRLLKDYKQHVKRGQLNFYCSHVCHREHSHGW